METARRWQLTFTGWRLRINLDDEIKIGFDYNRLQVMVWVCMNPYAL